MNSGILNDFFSTNKTININGQLIDFAIPRVMGILNVTPDSFFDGGRYTSDADILNKVGSMLEEGASFIDVGAYSTRPGAKDIPEKDEEARAVHAVRIIKKEYPDATVSIDTFRSRVARACAGEGAGMVNDISAGELDAGMLETVAGLGIPYIAMHSRGNPQTMSKLTEYGDLLKDITNYFHQRLHLMQQLGLKDIIVDPGFGFAKTVEQNFVLLKNLEYYRIFGRPVLVGLSRKSLIWKTLSKQPDDALNGTTVLNTIAIIKGANILRVHDVKEAIEIIRLVTRMNETGNPI